MWELIFEVKNMLFFLCCNTNEHSYLPFPLILCSVSRFCCPGGPHPGSQSAGTGEWVMALIPAPSAFFFVVVARGRHLTVSHGENTVTRMHHPSLRAICLGPGHLGEGWRSGYLEVWQLLDDCGYTGSKEGFKTLVCCRRDWLYMCQCENRPNL